MQQWEDCGIVISVSRYGEQSAIVRLLTQQHGFYPAMVKGAFGKSARGVYQPGNVVHVRWQARLEEQLGHFQCELLRSHTAELLSDPLALHVMNAVVAMISTCVPERINEDEIYNNIINILNYIQANDEDNSLLLGYARFEFLLLQALGFGLDLEECAATGRCDAAELIYVSPKSGRAVSREAGEPYKDRLLSLPEFLKQEEAQADMRQLLDGLALTGYFLEGWVLHPEGKKMPDARKQLLNLLSKKI